jgi:type IV pilus assembly protein PilQ
MGSCAAAGVAIAVGLAGHFAKTTTNEPVSTSQAADVAEKVDEYSKSLDQPLASPAAPRTESQSTQANQSVGQFRQDGSFAPQAANQQVAFPPAPYYMHYQEPRSDQIERLERALQRVTDASTQSQIEKLEERLAELSKPKSVPSEAAVDTVAAQSPTARLAQHDVSTGQRIDAPGQLDMAGIRRGEGDDRLTLNLRGQDLRELLEFLSAEAGLNILTSENVIGNVTASLSDMDAKSAILAILRIKGFVAKEDGNFLYVGTPADLKRMENLNDTVQTRIYRTDYVTAAEVQALIAPMLSADGKVTVSSPAETSIPADTVNSGGDDFAGNEVIMVQDYETVLLRVDEVVAEIDQRPRQVMIEAMIISVGLDDSHSVGINFEAFQQKHNLRITSGAPLANLGQINVSNGGLQFGVLDGNIGAFISALEGIGDTDVIAAPHQLCQNKQKAEILIGDQKGYLSTTQTETATTQTVEFLDVGTQLRIRPFISSDGMVRLEVHPELSTGDVKLVGTFALPEKSTTQVTTNIMCRDGCTVVIGGLIREDHARTITQAAIIGNLPILGELFRNRKIENQRSEIIVLLTPRVVQDPMICKDAAGCRAAVSDRRAAVALRKISPIARHHYGRRYYRLAQSAWYAGNIAEAQRYLDITLQMNPHDIMAKRLLGIMMGGEAQGVPLEHELPDGATNGNVEEIEPLEFAPMPSTDPPPIRRTPPFTPPLPELPSNDTLFRQNAGDGNSRRMPPIRPVAATMVPLTSRPIESSVGTGLRINGAGLIEKRTASEFSP